jgi:hypothetical protein
MTASVRGCATAFVIPVTGGAACYAEVGSPLNKIVGLGFGGVPSGHRGGIDQPGLSTRFVRERVGPIPPG